MNLNTGNASYRREPKPTAEDNTQPRFELFLLGDGEKKVTEEADTREFSYLSLFKIANVCCFYMKPKFLGSHPMGLSDSACTPTQK